MRKFFYLFFLGNFCAVSLYADSFLTAQQFPKTFEDLSFQARLDLIEDGLQPFADLSAYDILNIVYTDENIPDEIAKDDAEDDAENNAGEVVSGKYSYEEDLNDNNGDHEYNKNHDYESHDKHGGYCQQIAPHIPQSQNIPIGKPVLMSDYKYCSGYGVRNFGTKDKPKYDNHYGFDIGCTEASYGRPVFTPANGVVERVKPNHRGSSAGNYILIDHKNGFKTYYMHLDTILVRQGQTVSAGCQIGTIGYTGGAKAFKKQFENVDYPVMRKGISHLHYEMHYSGSLQSVNDSNGNTIPIVHKFKGSQSIDPAPFMGVGK